MNEKGEKIGTEPWLDWQIRSMSAAGSEIDSNNLKIGHLLDKERLAWAARVSRFGLGPGSCTHICKYVVAWRSRFWWDVQKMYNDLNWQTIKHVFPFKPRRWEDSLPPNWLIHFTNTGPLGVPL